MPTYPKPRGYHSVIEVGLDRSVAPLLPFPNPGGIILNLGAGNKEIVGCHPIDAEHGWFAGDRLPFSDETVDGVYALHFFEHLTTGDAIAVTREIERVLVPGGSLITVTPHPAGELAFQDIDHKSFWNEMTWPSLFSKTYRGADGKPTEQYHGSTSRDWCLSVHTSLIVGVVLLNLVTVTQIVKQADKVPF